MSGSVSISDLWLSLLHTVTQIVMIHFEHLTFFFLHKTIQFEFRLMNEGTELLKGQGMNDYKQIRNIRTLIL